MDHSSIERVSHEQFFFLVTIAWNSSIPIRTDVDQVSPSLRLLLQSAGFSCNNEPDLMPIEADVEVESTPDITFIKPNFGDENPIGSNLSSES